MKETSNLVPGRIIKLKSPSWIKKNAKEFPELPGYLSPAEADPQGGFSFYNSTIKISKLNELRSLKYEWIIENSSDVTTELSYYDGKIYHRERIPTYFIEVSKSDKRVISQDLHDTYTSLINEFKFIVIDANGSGGGYNQIHRLKDRLFIGFKADVKNKIYNKEASIGVYADCGNIHYPSSFEIDKLRRGGKVDKSFQATQFTHMRVFYEFHKDESTLPRTYKW